MTEPPRRKRFQIHLSTAVVMMFVAGALIWANLYKSRTYWRYGGGKPSSVETPTHSLRKVVGWPFESERRFTFKGKLIDGQDTIIESESWLTALPVLLVDLIIAMGLLAAMWFLCEWLIRRRAARKET